MPVRKWGSEQLVNTTQAGTQFHPSVAALDNGGYVIVWEDDGPATHLVRGQRYDAAGHAMGSEFAIQTFGDAGESPAVTSLAGGGFVVGFDFVLSTTDSDPVFQRFDAAGNPVGVADIDIDTETDLASQVSIARLTGGGFVEVYHDPDLNSGDVKLSIRDPNGAVVNGRNGFLANSGNTLGDQFNPDVAALANGGFVVAWNNANQDLRMSVSNADASYYSSPSVVNTTSVAGDNSKLTVTGLANGGVVVAWETFDSPFPGNGYDIRARLFDPNGNPLGSDFLVNTTTVGTQLHSDVVATSDGGFVIVYGDGDSSGIRGQAFDTFGGRLGREFILSTSTADIQSASASTLADGRIVVTWTSFDGLDTNIHSQIIDPRDGLIYGTSSADTLYGHNTVNDEISGLNGDDILYGLGGSDALYGGEGNDALIGGNGDDDLRRQWQ